MHFASFVINLLAWTFIGTGLGFFLHKGTSRSKYASVFIGSIFSLLGGVFSSMTHGMYPEVGIDFLNLTISFAFAASALYIFIPNTRESIVNAGIELYSRTKNFVLTIQMERSSKFPYLNSHFWKNITSLIPR